MLATVSPDVWGPILGVILAGIGGLIWRVGVFGVAKILARIEAVETRVCTELAANTTLTGATLEKVAHQGAQIAYLQGRIGVGFEATSNEEVAAAS